MATLNEKPVFFDQKNASNWAYRPDVPLIQREAAKFRNNFNIKPSQNDNLKVEMLLIDMQKDFCHKEGSLYVGGQSGEGAIDDCNNVAKFIYENLNVISKITPTMDSHFPMQIFFDFFWVDANGNKPEPMTMITADDIRKGVWMVDPAVGQLITDKNGQPNYAWVEKQVRFYADQLEKSGKYALTIWPYHCVIGDDGHALTGVIQEARMFHSFTRQVQTSVEIKGVSPFTENYSVFGAEVTDRHDGRGALAQKNMNLVKRLLENDAVIIAGEAASHCVLWSVDDLLNEVRRYDESLVSKIYLLNDCTSAVSVPDGNGGYVVDFTPDVTAAFDRWKGEGVNIVDTATDIRDWPGVMAQLG